MYDYSSNRKNAINENCKMIMIAFYKAGASFLTRHSGNYTERGLSLFPCC